MDQYNGFGQVNNENNIERNMQVNNYGAGYNASYSVPSDNRMSSEYNSSLDYSMATDYNMNNQKKKKEKTPITFGKVVALGMVFVMITVLINSAVLVYFYDSVKDNFITKEQYAAMNIQSTSDTINNMTSQNNNSGNNGSTTGLSVADIAEAVMPSVVAITSKTVSQNKNPFYGYGSYQIEGAGSGIIVGKNETELLIVTNNHVVADTTSLTVSFTNDVTIEKAYVKGTSSKNDIAVVAIPLDDIDDKTLGYIKIATLGDSDAMRVGDGVIAIGNALGYGQSVTVGYVSAKDREITTEDATLNVIQIDAAINGGNSGGALLNMNGEVIGINVAKSSASGSETSVEGMGYAIPISEAKSVIEKLASKETRYPVAESEKGYLGVKVSTSDETTYMYYNIPMGAYISEIVEGSAASKSDLQVGDVIVGINDEEIKTADELVDVVSTYKAGETIKLTVMTRGVNGYVEKEIEVTLGGADTVS